MMTKQEFIKNYMFTLLLLGVTTLICPEVHAKEFPKIDAYTCLNKSSKNYMANRLINLGLVFTLKEAQRIIELSCQKKGIA